MRLPSYRKLHIWADMVAKNGYGGQPIDIAEQNTECLSNNCQKKVKILIAKFSWRVLDREFILIKFCPGYLFQPDFKMGNQR